VRRLISAIESRAVPETLKSAARNIGTTPNSDDTEAANDGAESDARIGLLQHVSNRRGWLGLAAGGAALAGVGWWLWPKPRILLPWKPWLGYAPLRVAAELGLCGDVTIEFEDVEEVADMYQGMMRGHFPIAMWLASTHALFTSRGLDAKVVLKLDESLSGDALVVKPRFVDDSAPKEKKYAALEGQPIAIQHDDAGEHLFRSFCSEFELNFERLQRRDSHKSPKDAAWEYKENDIAAATSYAPYLTADMAGDIAWTAAMMKTATGFGIVDVLVVRSDYLEENGDLVAGLIEGWFQALKLLDRANPDRRALEIAAECLKTDETPHYSAKDFLNDTDPATMIVFGDAVENCRFFKNRIGGSFFKRHYDNGADVFKGVHQVPEFAAVDGSTRLLETYCP
jgi:ABC-type nitrate/sulfonate/bicarbonate transport system substrate-binding protein